MLYRWWYITGKSKKNMIHGAKVKDGIMNRQEQKMRREFGFYAIKTAAIKSENATNQPPF